MQLPKHILKELASNKTSLGEHPSFPPEDEEKFSIKLISKYFDIISKDYQNIDELELKNELGKLIVECKKLELNCRENLEKLCEKIITELFDIPEDTINIEVHLMDCINTDNQRLIPEKTEDFEFDDISDINNLTDEVYKRRLLNALVAGASLEGANVFSDYLKDLFEINPELPSLYKKILDINRVLLYTTKQTLDVNSKENMDGGKVDVIIASEDNKVQIKADAVIFPILIEETIHGLLELAISHGLPEEKRKANYVMSKADFKLAELWDIRFGLPLWSLIEHCVKECDFDINDIGRNFLLMTIAQMPTNDFNDFLQELFAGTRRGKMILCDILNDITHQKEKDSFDDFMQQNNDKYQINDDDFFDATELLTEYE